MGVRITPVTESFLVGENLTWLTHGYEDALETADSITLDSTSLAALFPASGNGSNLVVIPSGVLLAKITATGKWGPYDTTTEDLADGRQLAVNATTKASQVGYLGKTTQLNATPSLPTLVDVAAPLIWQGEVSISKLAAATGLTSGIGVADDAAMAALQIRFVA